MCNLNATAIARSSVLHAKINFKKNRCRPKCIVTKHCKVVFVIVRLVLSGFNIRYNSAAERTTPN